MKILRDEFYFGPRCINLGGKVRWYGECYQHDKLKEHYEETVYIRDNGSELYIYKLISDDCDTKTEIRAVFTLICKIEKLNDKWIYGRKNA